MRMKKQQKRKEREKAKQKKKQPDKPQVAPSTLGGITGEVIDKYRKRTMQEYTETVKLCDMHGVQLSKGLLGRGKKFDCFASFSLCADLIYMLKTIR